MSILARKLKGDTLIEVLFAFVILSAVISVAFGGAMSSYRSALTAQNRSQALFLAQYQADALKTYRDSLDWDNGGQNVSFLNGNTTTLGNTNITAVKNADGTYLSNFCMDNVVRSTAQAPLYWKIVTNQNECNNLAKSLASNLNSPSIKISLSSSAPDRVLAKIVVSYNAANNSSVVEQVTNSIILIK
jgi:Tfp pilus assembly protein PilV